MKHKIMRFWQRESPPDQQFRASEYELVKDGRSYGTILLKCDDLQEAFRPETENPRIEIHRRQGRPQEYIRENSNENEYTRKWNPREFHVGEHINAEAEEFIHMEHQKFNVRLNKRTWSSG